ncbi:MAG: threonine/serine exporter family protein [Prevotellaceae bacterium]|jgi:uncharacterized membrane protein YjjP (DUF1212 family)|nr:threonine/serine exporter family protein [Prevotellaceae bacterium]
MNTLSINIDSTKMSRLNRIVNFALDVGTFLLSSGAHCGRINRNINRMVKSWDVKIELYFSFTGILATAYYIDNPNEVVTRYKKAPEYGVNFNAINEVSQLSWLLDSKKVSVEEANEALQEIKAIKPYPKILLLLGIGMSCACLCFVAGGDWRDAIFAFVAAICGMLVKLMVQKRGFNAMVALTFAAFVTTFIASLNMVGALNPIWGAGLDPHSAMATAVLYLVPRVPLTNSVIDLIESYISTSLFRAAFGAFILLCIAVGMSLSIVLFGINNF